MKLAVHAFIRIATHYTDEIHRNGHARPRPLTCDRLAQAALLLVSDFRDELLGSPDVKKALKDAMAAIYAEQNSAGGDFSFVALDCAVDMLPWDLMRSILEKEAPLALFEEVELRRKIQHGNSSIRYWSMQNAWICRQHLNARYFLPALFENISETLGYVNESGALARELAGSAESFVSECAIASPGDTFDQFRDRIAMLVENDYAAQLSMPFIRLENELRARTARIILTVEEDQLNDPAKQLILDL